MYRLQDFKTSYDHLCAPLRSGIVMQHLQEWNMSGVQPLYPRCRCLQCQSKLHIPRDLWSRLGGHKERDRWTDRPADYLDLICLKWKDAPGFVRIARGRNSVCVARQMEIVPYIQICDLKCKTSRGSSISCILYTGCLQNILMFMMYVLSYRMYRHIVETFGSLRWTGYTMYMIRPSGPLFQFGPFAVKSQASAWALPSTLTEDWPNWDPQLAGQENSMSRDLMVYIHVTCVYMCSICTIFVHPSPTFLNDLRIFRVCLV